MCLYLLQPACSDVLEPGDVTLVDALDQAAINNLAYQSDPKKVGHVWTGRCHSRLTFDLYAFFHRVLHSPLKYPFTLRCRIRLQTSAETKVRTHPFPLSSSSRTNSEAISDRICSGTCSSLAPTREHRDDDPNVDRETARLNFYRPIAARSISPTPAEAGP